MLPFRLRLAQPASFDKQNSKSSEFKTSNLRFIHFYSVPFIVSLKTAAVAGRPGGG
jgi:hypothetical protein